VIFCVCDRTKWSSSTWLRLFPPGTLSPTTNSNSKHWNPNMMLNATSGTQSALRNWDKWWLRRACNSSGSPHWPWQLPPSLTNPSQSGSPRGISLLDHCTGKSAVMPTPTSKRRVRTNTKRNALECAVWKNSAKFEKDVRRGRDYRSSWTRWHSKHNPNVGCVHTLRKCLVRGMSLKTREGGSQFFNWKQRCENIRIHSY